MCIVDKMHIERFFVNKKNAEFIIKIDDDEINIFRRDSNGAFEITIYSSNETYFYFGRQLHLSSDNIKKENISDHLKKPLDDYTYENVKNNLMYVNKTREEKARYIDNLAERYLEWVLAKKLIE